MVNYRAMIFAAGLGTRFKPWTDTHPKALAIINGKSLLQRNIEYLQQYGIREVVVNVHHFAEQVIQAVQQNNGWGSNVIISNEEGEVLETGGGLLKAQNLLGSELPFITLNVDILTDLNMHKLMDVHNTANTLITLAVSERSTQRYFLFDDANRLCGWRNTKTQEERLSIPVNGLRELAYSGIAAFRPEVFSLIQQRGKFSLVDVYLSLAAQHIIKGYCHTHEKWVDVGRPESVAIAEKLFK